MYNFTKSNFVINYYQTLFLQYILKRKFCSSDLKYFIYTIKSNLFQAFKIKTKKKPINTNQTRDFIQWILNEA